jgi:uncharacterized protein (DUF305 family)
MRRVLMTATAAIALLGAGALVLAQAQPQHGPGHGMPMMRGGGHAGHAAAQAPANASPVTRAFMAANERMHRDMAITFSGNADRDFVAGMIPHHQGAIDMARLVLEHGSDPEVRAIAEAVIREQEREIVQMRSILARIPAP